MWGPDECGRPIDGERPSIGELSRAEEPRRDVRPRAPAAIAPAMAPAQNREAVFHAKRRRLVNDEPGLSGSPPQSCADHLGPPGGSLRDIGPTLPAGGPSTVAGTRTGFTRNCAS